jgi:hypothetical protein
VNNKLCQPRYLPARQCRAGQGRRAQYHCAAFCVHHRSVAAIHSVQCYAPIAWCEPVSQPGIVSAMGMKPSSVKDRITPRSKVLLPNPMLYWRAPG